MSAGDDESCAYGRHMFQATADGAFCTCGMFSIHTSDPALSARLWLLGDPHPDTEQASDVPTQDTYTPLPD